MQARDYKQSSAGQVAPVHTHNSCRKRHSSSLQNHNSYTCLENTWQCSRTKQTKLEPPDNASGDPASERHITTAAQLKDRCPDTRAGLASALGVGVARLVDLVQVGQGVDADIEALLHLVEDLCLLLLRHERDGNATRAKPACTIVALSSVIGSGSLAPNDKGGHAWAGVSGHMLTRTKD